MALSVWKFLFPNMNPSLKNRVGYHRLFVTVYRNSQMLRHRHYRCRQKKVNMLSALQSYQYLHNRAPELLVRIQRDEHVSLVFICMCTIVAPVCAGGWKLGFPMGKARITHPSDVDTSQLSSSFPLTVKDLLLSGTSEPVSILLLPDREGGDGWGLGESVSNACLWIFHCFLDLRDLLFTFCVWVCMCTLVKKKKKKTNKWITTVPDLMNSARGKAFGIANEISIFTLVCGTLCWMCSNWWLFSEPERRKTQKIFISILPKMIFSNLPITFIHSYKILEIKYLLNVWRILYYVALLNSILWRESLLGQHIRYSHFTHSHKKKLDYQVKITMTRIIR